jgi:hypothetical protein
MPGVWAGGEVLMARIQERRSAIQLEMEVRFENIGDGEVPLDEMDPWQIEGVEHEHLQHGQEGVPLLLDALSILNKVSKGDKNQQAVAYPEKDMG